MAANLATRAILEVTRAVRDKIDRSIAALPATACSESGVDDELHDEAHCK
jgi:hypothetical protein